MAKSESTHGGKREKAGRKPIEDKKVTVPIYPQQSRIKVLGIDTIKQVALDAVEKAYKKKIKNT